MAKQIEKIMKKIVICTAVLAMMTVVSSSASQTFDDPPQKKTVEGKTRVDESCREHGVSYERNESYVQVYPSEDVDVNMTVERQDGTSQSYDTRRSWDQDAKVKSTDDVDIKCYPKKQEKSQEK